MADLEHTSSTIEPLHFSVPGRARFHVQGLYHSQALRQTLERELAYFNEVRRVSANPLTGNILVEFDPSHSPREIANLLEDIAGNRHRASRRGGFGSDGNSNKTTEHSPNGLVGGAANANGLTGHFAQDIWHCRSAGEVARNLGSSEKGLSQAAAVERLREYGPNRLPEPELRSPLAILFDQLNSLPAALLVAAAGISLVTGGMADAIAITGVLVANAAIGYFTESQSEKAIRSLKTTVQPSVSVIRGGNLQQVSAENMVPGDLIVLRPGIYVCADARLMEAEHLTVDESVLTGESLPVTKTAKTLADLAIPLADRTNMLYMGTLVTGGEGLAMVVATGLGTELGQVQKLTSEAQSPETPMERQLSEVGRQLVLVCTSVCGLVFGLGLLRGYGLFEMLKTAISLAVASVPEGLPTVAATTLALGIQKMRRHGVIICKLAAVETLGCVQTICLDKTGTLTLNRMEVTGIHCARRRLKFRSGTFAENGRLFRVSRSAETKKLAEICVLCSESAVEHKAGEYVVTGSPTENALIQMALAAKIEPLALRSKYPLIRMVGRSENRNFMYTLHRPADEERRDIAKPLLVAVKGSPGEVLAMCRWVLRRNRPAELTDSDRLEIAAENDRMAGAALRVLGIAYRELARGPEHHEIESNLIWLGLVGMADPIRDGVGPTVQAFHRAGIDTVMITGDQRQTAFAVGKELSLSRNGSLNVFDSAQLGKLAGFGGEGLSEHAQVFARVSPANKLQIVQALQRAGKIVAMTGDGINDSPALKAADIGIAMGSAGTDAARNVADVVLENDDLQTMLIAIGEGRTIYRNIRKSLHFALSTNFSEILVVFIGLAIGLGQPFNAMQLLWINLISDIWPGLALALEPPEPGVMTESPRAPEERVLKNSDFFRIATESAALSGGALAVYGYGVARYGLGAQASTLAFTSLTSAQLLHAASCRSAVHSCFSGGHLPSNRYLFIALIVSGGAQALTLFVPGLRKLLNLNSVNPSDAFLIAAGAVAPFIINEATKLLSWGGTDIGGSANGANKTGASFSMGE